MTQDAAVRSVVSLVPDIEKRGAVTVLLEHARKEDLPPAQLEKLAQVFNTLRTVSHIDSAQDRGSSVPLLDVPAMMLDYVVDPGAQKAARAPHAFETHDVNLVDLRKMVVPTASEEMAKAAAAKADPRPVRFKVDSDTVINALVELEVDLRDAMSKKARELIGVLPRTSDREVDLSRAEEDALHLVEAHQVKAGAQWLESYLRPHRVTLLRYEGSGELKKRSAQFASQGGRLLAELSRLVSERDVLVKMAARKIPRGVVLEEIPTEPDYDPDQLEFPAFSPLTEEAEEAEEKGETETKRDLLKEVVEGKLDDVSESSQQGAGGVPPPPPGGEGDPEAKDKSPRTGGMGEEKSKKGPGVISKTYKVTTAPLRAAARGVRGANAALKDKLDKITSQERFNKSQRDVDVSVEDIRRSINLRRMIGGDPVLREADPKEVLEIYNAIARVNPEIASNMPALRLILREAVSYEGLTLDAVKQLADVRKSTGQSEDIDHTNERRRYSVGGNNPLLKK